MSNSLKRRYSEGLKPSNLRAILVCDCLENPIGTFESKKAAAIALNIREGGIKKCLSGEFSQHKGYTFSDAGKACPLGVPLNASGDKKRKVFGDRYLKQLLKNTSYGISSNQR